MHAVTVGLCLASWLGQSANPRLFAQEDASIAWENLPNIPPAVGQERQAGLAGPFVGLHADALLVAGGANFPAAPPWDGGAKVWWDDVFVLSRNEQGVLEWQPETQRLPRPLAYGVSVSSAEGLICIGGCDADSCFADVFRLTWLAAEQRIQTQQFPPLPFPLADMGGALVGQTIYVAGGRETASEPTASRRFLALDLSLEHQPRQFRWRELPAWPGPARVLPVAAAQSDGESTCFFLFSGRDVAPGKRSDMLVDGYKYIPQSNRWIRIADVAPTGQAPRCVMGAASSAWGGHQVIVWGGDDGRLFLERESLEEEADGASDLEVRRRSEAALTQSFLQHPGFTRDVLAYDAVNDAWSIIGTFPEGKSPVTTTAVRWDDAIVVPSGEIRPGVRTPTVLRVKLSDAQP